MTVKNFDDLVITKQLRHKLKHSSNKRHNGLDTETYQGYVKLITDSYGRYKFINSFDEILEFLTYSKFVSKYNWFYNIRFDFESIVKYLPIEILKELYETNKINYHAYQITYIPQKCFSILVNNKSYKFFDLNNFLETSLSNASKTFLNKDKFIDLIDASRLNTDIDYWNEKEDDIIKYCIQDSVLTKELGEWFFKLLKDTVDFIPNTPYSKGSYSQDYFLSKCYVPTINNIDRNVLKFAHNSYSGGRFEILKRGYYENIHLYDIKSAYPAQMTKLIDINLGEWNYTNKFIDNAYYGYYLCNIKFFNRYFSPFMQKLYGLNVYPNGLFTQYLTQNEILFIYQNFNNVEIDVIEGYYYLPKYETFPLINEIDYLYKWKEREKDFTIKQVVKIILNSLYGKFIQTVNNKTGKIYNPIWATEITANTRLELLNLALKKPENIISFSTDSVITSSELNINDNGKIGSWNNEFNGNGIFVMSDVYSLWNDNLDIKDRFRGFKLNIEVTSNNNTMIIKSLKEIIQQMKDDNIYEYTVFRPIHLGEIILHHKQKNLSMLNVWHPITKRFNINGDNKRIWNNQFKSGYDVYESQHSSIPIMLD